MNKPETLPALDDITLRKKQAERFTEGIGNLGDYAKELKKTQKLQLTIALVSAGLFLLLIGITVVAMVWKGGIGGLVDLGVADRYFNCTSEQASDQLRFYHDAVNFKELYNGTCIVYHKNAEAKS